MKEFKNFIICCCAATESTVRVLRDIYLFWVVDSPFFHLLVVLSVSKGGLTSEFFLICSNIQIRDPYPSFFFGDLNQSEKVSKIRPPLVTNSRFSWS